MQTPSADTYRIVGSTNPPPALKATLAKFGIVDHCNALKGRNRTKHCQVFVMKDGHVMPEIGSVIAAAVREAKEAR